jgi:DNA invertase Pin-like site-specific DNA recombinase
LAVTLSPGWATYLRVSDEDKQSPERSFAFQRKSIVDHLLKSSDIPFKKEYCDLLTGTSPNRKDYQQLLADAEAGRFSHLGLYRADRFGRDAVEGLQAATKLIALGIKLRVANMPTLMPETPDGFFMFLLQMGLAQREVDVLRERTRDGMDAKLRAGGWPQKAPDGYLNKERQVSSNKYDRWVELDPEYGPVLRLAWDLLLTGKYTLDEICELLTEKGYTRPSGRPWAWTDPATGIRRRVDNRLHKIMHNPFYAGWVVSERFGIKMGEVRGNWEPIVTTEEFYRGVEILHKNDNEKSRVKKAIYLLRGFLYARVNGEDMKMYGSTPSGRNQSYAYYMTHAKPFGKKIYIPCNVVDNQIPVFLNGISVDPALIPEIRSVYEKEVKKASSIDREQKLVDMNRQLSQLKEEEARLGRLYITGKMGDATYNQLRAEWQEKLRRVELELAELDRDASIHLDDLDAALALLAKASDLYPRLEEKQRSTLLQILVKRIIVDAEGEIIDYELNSPFVYLRSITRSLSTPENGKSGSEQISEGAQAKNMPSGVFCFNYDRHPH